jgi:hypothetical protein
LGTTTATAQPHGFSSGQNETVKHSLPRLRLKREVTLVSGNVRQLS